MAFRDDSEATRARADALQREVEAARGELRALRTERADAELLRARLADAERKLAALQGPQRPSHRRIASWIAFVALLLAIGLAFRFARDAERDEATAMPSVGLPDMLPPGVAAKEPPRGLEALVLVGVDQRTIAILGALAPTQNEIDGLAAVKRAGASNGACLELLRAARANEGELLHGPAAASLLQAGVSEASLVALARLRQLGWAADVLAMRRAGAADATILQLALLRSRGQLAIGGEDVARLRHAGFDDEPIVRLAYKGLRSAHVAGLVAQRRGGMAAAAIVARYRDPRAAEKE